MADEATSLGRLSTRRSFGGLRLISALRMAFDVRKLVIAAVGLLLIQIGWVALDRAMPASAAATPEPFGSPEILGFPHQRSIGQNTIALTMRLSEPIRLLTTPLLALLDPASDAMMMIHAMLGLIWLILVWGICGGAIARLATIQEAQMRQPGILEGLRFARQSSTWLIVAPLCPLLGIGFCSLLGAGFGLLYRVPHGAILAGILLVFPILAGLLMAMLAAGLVAGWPLHARRRRSRLRRCARRAEPDLQLPESTARPLRRWGGRGMALRTAWTHRGRSAHRGSGPHDAVESHA